MTRPAPSGRHVEELLRRAHARFIQLKDELQAAEQAEVDARARLAQVQAEADEVFARVLPTAAKIAEAILADAASTSASILSAADASAADLAADVRAGGSGPPA